MEDLDLPKFEKIIKKTKKVLNKYPYDSDLHWPVSNNEITEIRKGKNANINKKALRTS